MSDDNAPEESGSECPSNTPCGSRNARNKAKKMDCAQLLDKINELTDTEKSGRAGPKGLLQRIRDYKGDDATHIGNIRQQQASLKAYLKEYQEKGYGPPPPLASVLAEKKIEAPESGADGADVANAAGKTALALGAGYVVYRGLRMLPSLFPPLWPTLPANVAIP